MAIYKKYIIKVWWIIVPLLLSCTNNTQTESSLELLPELAEAENIMYAHPDSALHILERMKFPKVSDKYQHATWCLLLTQAKVKNYIKLESDSIISIAFNYFQQQDNPQRKALAGYLQGIYYNDEKNNAETALEYYIEAAKEVEKTEDFQLAHLIYAEIGHLYVYRALLDYAITAYQNAYDYAKLAKNKTYIATSLSYIGRAYSVKPDKDKAVYYYKTAVEAAQKADNNQLPTAKILNELAAVYTDFFKDYRQALIYAMEALEINKCNKKESPQNYLTIGNIYRYLEMNDSAQLYLEKATHSNNIYTTYGAYQALYYLNRSLPEKYHTAMQYCDQFYMYTDSITKIKHDKEIIAMKEKYEHEKLLNEKKTLQIKSERLERNTLYIVLFITIICAIPIFYYQRKLIRKKRTIQMQEEQLHSYNLRIYENEVQMERNEAFIAQLTEQLAANNDLHETMTEQQIGLDELKLKNEKLHEETKLLQQDMAEYSDNMQGELKKQLASFDAIADENTRLRKREDFLCKLLISYIKPLDSFIKNPKQLTASQWAELTCEINRIYDDFTLRLSKQIPTLTENDLQVCCLIKIHLTVANMASVLNISPTSVSKRKQRIKDQLIKVLGDKFDKKQILDFWIWAY